MAVKETENSNPGSFKILVFGGDGMLGTEVVESLKAAGYAVHPLLWPGIDITKPESVRSVFAEHSKPGLVINCSAYTAVDKAESEPDVAFAVNRDGVARISDACLAAGTPLIHISTDYVFDGLSNIPYTEEDPAGPAGVYAASKWEGEEAVRSRLAEHLIIRTAWMYGVGGMNFVKTILKLARERRELTIIDDQFGCPTWSRDLAACITQMVSRIRTSRGGVPWGTYHFCGKGVTTWYGFTRKIVEHARRKESLKVAEVKPIPTTAYPLPAPRPAWSVLDCAKIGKAFGISPPPWEESLALMLEELWLSEASQPKSIST